MCPRMMASHSIDKPTIFRNRILPPFLSKPGNLRARAKLGGWLSASFWLGYLDQLWTNVLPRRNEAGSTIPCLQPTKEIVNAVWLSPLGFQMFP